MDEWQGETVKVRGSLEFKGFDEEEEEEEAVADAAKKREGEKCKHCLHKNG